MNPRSLPAHRKDKLTSEVIFMRTLGRLGDNPAAGDLVAGVENAGVARRTLILGNLDSVDVDQLAMQILRIALDLPENAP